MRGWSIACCAVHTTASAGPGTGWTWFTSPRSHGHDQDRIRPNAWPYRDYLIESFNADTTVRPVHPGASRRRCSLSREPRLIVALGMIAAGPWDESSLRDIRDDSIDRQIGHYIDRDDMVSTVMSTFVSMTVQCARCHDHKFDPITQDDYYGLQAVFAGVDRAERAYDPDPKVNLLRQALHIAQRLRPQDTLLGEIEIATLPPLPLRLRGGQRLHSRRQSQVARWTAAGARAEAGRHPQARSRGRSRHLACVRALPGRFELANPGNEGSRRAALAKWLSDPRNPLTYRSIVNRLWQHHFGRGIVDTPNDFGRMGSMPTHPELLDWLAARFLAEGGLTEANAPADRDQCRVPTGHSSRSPRCGDRRRQSPALADEPPPPRCGIGSRCDSPGCGAA